MKDGRRATASFRNDATRVLVVDDELSIVEDFRRILAPRQSAFSEGDFEIILGSTVERRSPNIDLEFALSAELGLELVEASLGADRRFSLAFVDVGLPGAINGIQLISRMWDHDPDIEMVLMTGRIDMDWGEMVDSLSRADRMLVLKKPFDVLEVRQLVHALCEKRRLQAELARNMASLEQTVMRRTADLERVNAELQKEMQTRLRTELGLREAQKLEAVGQLASGIAHEINTPIQFIGDSVEFLRESFGDVMGLLDRYRSELATAARERRPPEMEPLVEHERELDFEFVLDEVPQAIERTRGGVRRVAEIVGGMRGFAHFDGDEMQFADLNAGVRDTLIVAHNEYKYHADVHTDLSELPAVECFVGQLNQVFLNLVVNSAHAIADRIAAQGGERGQITISTRARGHCVEIRIGDTGGGIPQSIRHRVFEPFFTTKDIGRGTGHGLAIAHRIVTEVHEGRLEFEVEPGVGTTFVIEIPVMSARLAA